MSRDREANRQYKAQWRKANPVGYAREKAHNSAQNRALWRLARLHSAQFRALVEEEKTKVELPRRAS